MARPHCGGGKGVPTRGALLALLLLGPAPAPRGVAGHETWDEYSFMLDASASHIGYDVWTAPVSHQIDRRHAMPIATEPYVYMSVARNEYEPLQLFFKDKRGFAPRCTATAMIPDIPDVTLYTGVYGAGADSYVEYLEPLSRPGAAMQLAPGEHAMLWVDVHIPANATASGNVNGRIEVSCTGGIAPLETMSIPLYVFIFDFQLAGVHNFIQEVHVTDAQTGTAGVHEANMNMLYRHRATGVVAGAGLPKGAAAAQPYTFDPRTTWEAADNPETCLAWHSPTRSATTATTEALDGLVQKYLKGEGWDCKSFAAHRAFTYRAGFATGFDDVFCGVDRAVDKSGYRLQVAKFLRALLTYAEAMGVQDQVYYLAHSTPTSADDIAEAVATCSLFGVAAFGVRIAIESPPDPRITTECGYHIWQVLPEQFDQPTAWRRLAAVGHGEDVWLRLTDTAETFDSPYPKVFAKPGAVGADTNADRLGGGMNLRVLGFLAWSVRARGVVVANNDVWPASTRMTIAAKLLREAAEDYEYLWLGNSKAHPEACQYTQSDVAALSVAQGLASWSTSDDKFMMLRHRLGLWLQGSSPAPPTLDALPSAAAAAPPTIAHYINFQDVGGDAGLAPDGNVHSVNAGTGGKNATEWLPIGWDAYDPLMGFGWYTSADEASRATVWDRNTDVPIFPGDDVFETSVINTGGAREIFRYAVDAGLYFITLGAGTAPGDTVTGVPPGDYDPSIPLVVTVNNYPIVIHYPGGAGGVYQAVGEALMYLDGEMTIAVGGNGVPTALLFVTAVPEGNQAPNPAAQANVIAGQCRLAGVEFADLSGVSPACRPCDVLSPRCETDAPPTAIPATPAPETDAPVLPPNEGGNTTNTTGDNTTDSDVNTTPPPGVTRPPRTFAPDGSGVATGAPGSAGATDATDESWVEAHWWVLAAAGGGVLLLALLGFFAWRHFRAPQFTGRVALSEFMANPEHEAMAAADSLHAMPAYTNFGGGSADALGPAARPPGAGLAGFDPIAGGRSPSQMTTYMQDPLGDGSAYRKSGIGGPAVRGAPAVMQMAAL